MYVLQPSKNFELQQSLTIYEYMYMYMYLLKTTFVQVAVTVSIVRKYKHMYLCTNFRHFKLVSIIFRRNSTNTCIKECYYMY